MSDLLDLEALERAGREAGSRWFSTRDADEPDHTLVIYAERIEAAFADDASARRGAMKVFYAAFRERVGELAEAAVRAEIVVLPPHLAWPRRQRPHWSARRR